MDPNCITGGGVKLADGEGEQQRLATSTTIVGQVRITHMVTPCNSFDLAPELVVENSLVNKESTIPLNSHVTYVEHPLHEELEFGTTTVRSIAEHSPQEAIGLGTTPTKPIVELPSMWI